MKKGNSPSTEPVPKNRFKTTMELLEKVCTYNSRKGCDKLFCKLHETDYLGLDDSDGNHNCIGCQLNDSLERIYTFLKQNKSMEDKEYTFTVFMLLMFIMIEKLHTVFRVIGITFEFVEENWNVLVRMRKWSNFIKHPKGFLFTHHPEYVFEDEITSRKNNQMYIDYSFVEKLYNKENEGNFNQTIQQLKNKNNVVVILPNPDDMMKDFLEVCEKFCQKIKDNPHFKEILIKRSTINDF